MPKHKFSLVACARWEEMQIQEWVEYHKSIGFNHVYLYSNDDDPTELFRTVAPYVHGADPFVTFRHWPEVGAQIDIYLHFLETFKHETEWFCFLDIDEFLVLKGFNDIFAFMLGYEDRVDCLYFNWVIYGNSDVARRDDRPTLTSYMRRAAKPDAHTKMLCRSDAIDGAAIRFGQSVGRGAFWHFLDNYKLPGLRCRDVLHHPMDGYSADFPASTGPFISRQGLAEAILERAYVAHFQFRSEEDFMRRWRRGGFLNGEQWRSIYENGVYKVVLERNNAVYDSYLADYWYHYTAPAMRFGTTPGAPDLPYDNVALNKPSWQSSVHEPNGTEPPLGRAQGEVHIYNRGDSSADAVKDLDVLASADGATWATLHSYCEPEPFGVDGSPLVVRPSVDGPFRFVMVRMKGSGCLSLDEVEVYGSMVDADIPLLGSALSVAGLAAT
jgi:hypothetical protein